MVPFESSGLSQDIPTQHVRTLWLDSILGSRGLVEILKFKAGETRCFRSSSATGNVVVQLAKNIMGAKKVVAIVGSDEKAEWINLGLGADVAVNYKHANQELTHATPEFAEAYFDNVGGAKSWTSLSPASKALVGLPLVVPHRVTIFLFKVALVMLKVLTNRLTMQVFLIVDYLLRPEWRQAYNDGKLKNTGGETIVKAGSLEDVPKIWCQLFQGRSTGNLLTEMPY